MSIPLLATFTNMFLLNSVLPKFEHYSLSQTSSLADARLLHARGGGVNQIKHYHHQIEPLNVPSPNLKSIYSYIQAISQIELKKSRTLKLEIKIKRCSDGIKAYSIWALIPQIEDYMMETWINTNGCIKAYLQGQGFPWCKFDALRWWRNKEIQKKNAHFRPQWELLENSVGRICSESKNDWALVCNDYYEWFCVNKSLKNYNDWWWLNLESFEL